MLIRRQKIFGLFKDSVKGLFKNIRVDDNGEPEVKEIKTINPSNSPNLVIKTNNLDIELKSVSGKNGITYSIILPKKIELDRIKVEAKQKASDFNLSFMAKSENKWYGKNVSFGGCVQIEIPESMFKKSILVKSGNGDIRVGKCSTNELGISADNGDIAVIHSEFKHGNVHTNNGNIRIIDLADKDNYDIDAKTKNGDVRMPKRSNKKLSRDLIIRSGNGDIKII
jgi:DUF4097 and DUF4098 domain-containing protein YvlB